MRSQNVPLSASMIQEKAVIFAKELNTENFQDSDGWLRRWNQRKNISLKTVSRESKSVTPEMVNAWSETSLSTLTGMAAANAMGDKLPMFVIGKAKNPRCFINVKFLPCRYRNNKKVGWMGNCLKSGSESWTGSLLLKEEMLLL